MDKINKFLRTIGKKRRLRIKEVLLLIMNNQLDTLDCKKLNGFKNFYRVRVGNDRIVFRKSGRGNLIVDIFNREKGYKNIDT